MPPAIRLANAPSSTSPPAWRKMSSDEQDMADFDLRDALADMTVRETSFSEFLEELRRAGKTPS